MNRSRKLFVLSWQQRRILFYACLILNLLRLALWLLPFRVLKRQLVGISSVWICPAFSESVSVDFIVWAVTVAGRYTPGGAMCLVKALTTQLLLSRYGYVHRLHIGVAKSDTQAFRAHAWVECQGRVVIGKLSDLGCFQPLSATGTEGGAR